VRQQNLHRSGNGHHQGGKQPVGYRKQLPETLLLQKLVLRQLVWGTGCLFLRQGIGRVRVGHGSVPAPGA